MKHFAAVLASLVLSTIAADASKIQENVPKDQISRIVAGFLRGSGDGRDRIVGIACDARQCAIYTEQEK